MFHVVPVILFLASEDAPSPVILEAGARSFAVTNIAETGRRLSPRPRAHARDDRGALGRDFRPGDRQAATRRLRPDPEVRGVGGEGEERRDGLVT